MRRVFRLVAWNPLTGYHQRPVWRRRGARGIFNPSPAMWTIVTIPE